MKFLHLSTGDVRGAFTGAYRLHENLREAGHESKMFVLKKSSYDVDVFTPSLYKRVCAKFFTKMLTQILKFLFYDKHEFRRKYFFPYLRVVSLCDLYNSISFKPDMIVVNYVADFLSADDLKNIQVHFGAPLVFYLMDAGMLTGGCHYPWDCRGFAERCGKCPVLKRPCSNDLSARVWINREYSFGKIRYSLVVGSEWLLGRSQESALHRGRRIDKILMGINSSLFRPRNKLLSLNSLGMDIDDDKIVIYFGAQQIDDPRKGFSCLFSALEILQYSLGSMLIDRLVLFTVGAQKPPQLEELLFKHVHLEYLNDKEAFATTYNAADVFICPSIEDAGPMMINEAMMSGVPVIAFSMGVAEDLIVDGETGYLAKNFDPDDLAFKILNFVKMNVFDRNEMSKKCREKAEKNSSQTVQVAKFIDLAVELNSHYLNGEKV